MSTGHEEHAIGKLQTDDARGRENSLYDAIGSANLVQDDQKPNGLPLSSNKGEAPSGQRSAVVAVACHFGLRTKVLLRRRDVRVDCALASSPRPAITCQPLTLALAARAPHESRRETLRPVRLVPTRTASRLCACPQTR